MSPEPTPAAPIANLAVYVFAPVADPTALRQALHAEGAQLGLKGSILTAEEGVNAFLAGPPEAVQRWLEDLCARFPDYPADAKWSYSAHVPFNRLASKTKPEIVTFRQGEVRQEATAPHVSAESLKAWLDEGRELVLLDTRNAFEFEQGSFDGAVQLGHHDFVSFAEAVQSQLPAWRDKTVVTFCTGGIRCEKAAPFMAGLGFASVYQLEGGILRYFEQVGGEHWHGSCFVFDQRVGLAPDLSPVSPTPPQPKRPEHQR